MPTTPQKAAGWRIDPPVSVPVASSAERAATAEAEPPDDPPGTRSAPSAACHGLTAGPKALVSFAEPMANSSQLTVPSMTPPSRHRLAVTVLS